VIADFDERVVGAIERCRRVLLNQPRVGQRLIVQLLLDGLPRVNHDGNQVAVEGSNHQPECKQDLVGLGHLFGGEARSLAPAFSMAPRRNGASPTDKETTVFAKSCLDSQRPVRVTRYLRIDCQRYYAGLVI